MPEDAQAIAYLTANAGVSCALTGRAEEADRAASFLLRHVDPASPVATWLHASLYLLTGRTEAAAPLLARLHPLIPNLGATGLSWLVSSLTSAGLASQTPLIVGAADRLTSLQRPDGSFASDDGPAFDVSTTMSALYALLLVTGREA